MEQLKAGQMFWSSPELLETLFSWLDPLSALRLVQSHVMDKKPFRRAFLLKLGIRSYNNERFLQEQHVKDLVEASCDWL